MKITKIETLWFDPMSSDEWEAGQGTSRQALPNNLWVQIYTDEGLVGLGETYYSPRAVSALIHDAYAPMLIGRDPRDTDNLWGNLFSFVNFCGHAGAEMRAISAIDVALWDLVGQSMGEPIYNVLGGRNRASIPIYNTCVGYGKHDDLEAWLHGRAGELAESLLAQGVRAMKVWPFDQFGPTLAGPDRPGEPVKLWGAESAAGLLGHAISNDDLKAGVKVVEDIREAVGDRMSIAIEGHARWDTTTATRIARALEPLDIMWLEEIIPPDNIDACLRLKQATSIPICQSERLLSRFAFRDLIERGAADIVMPDLSWCGGITETRRICSLADTHYLPVTLHDTIGPVSLWASTHMMLHLPNAAIMETVRAYLEGWYLDVVTERIPVSAGNLSLEARPGLGTALQPDLAKRPGARMEMTDEARVKHW